jgi:hypothetical protein
MKNLNKIILCGFVLLFSQIGFGQVKVNAYGSTSNIASGTQFIDAASSSGKGLVFPRVNLITLTTLTGSSINKMDGMLVYNTATGTSGIGAIAVKPGFFYYSNQSTNINGGTWISVGGGATALGVVATVAAYTALDTDSTIFCDATTAAFTVTLPNPVGISGKVYVIRKTDATDNVITFSPSLVFSQGVTVSSLNYIKTIRVQSDGTNWNIID